MAVDVKSKKINIPSVKDLFEARVHLGHQTRRWSPLMAPFIFTSLKKTHLIDLETTHKALQKAVGFLQGFSKQDRILFVGTKRQAKDLIVKYAKKTNSLYVSERWIGGILTNYGHIKKSLNSLGELEKGLAAGEFAHFTKKERLLIERRIKRDKRFLGGLSGMEGLPSALIIVDPKRERVALKEAQRMHIPVVALVDTNTDPSGVDYIVPGNDDAISSLDIFLKTLSQAIVK